MELHEKSMIAIFTYLEVVWLTFWSTRAAFLKNYVQNISSIKEAHIKTTFFKFDS